MSGGAWGGRILRGQRRSAALMSCLERVGNEGFVARREVAGVGEVVLSSATRWATAFETASERKPPSAFVEGRRGAVLAHLLERDEAEILVLPENVDLSAIEAL